MRSTMVWANRILVLLCLGALVVGCKRTRFTQAHSDPDDWEPLTCRTDPVGVVDHNRPVSIMVSGAEGYKGRVEQTISGAGPVANQTATLVAKDGTFVREDGRPNTHTFPSTGEYTIRLKTLEYNVKLDASCTVSVIDACPQGTERKGMNLAFIVDNSNSHGKSDCPNSESLGKDSNGNELFQCSRTHREMAVEYATQILGELGKRGGDGVSYVGFNAFPKDGNQVFSAQWYNATSVLQQTTFSGLRQRLAVLRKPRGVTPYKEGLEGALKLFQSRPQSGPTAAKKNILLMVTDGYPTDKKPAEVRSVALQLKSLQVFIVTVIVTNEHSQDRLVTMHKKYMRDNFFKDKNGPRSWFSAVDYANDELYFSDLFGLVPQISDQVVYLRSSYQLQEKVKSLMAQRALQCES